MPSPSAALHPEADPPFDRTLGFLCLAPTLALLAGAVHGVPSHTSAAAGWIGMTSLPALLLALALRRIPSPRALSPLLLLLALAVLHPRDRDAFEARRAVLTLTTLAGLVLSGASLGRAGRRAYARGLTLATAAGLAFAWVDTYLRPVRAFAGALENSGDLSETLLPGALLACAAAGFERGALRFVCLATALAYTATVGWVPVLAGATSFFLAAGVAIGVGRSLPRHALLLALVAFGATFAYTRTAVAPAQEARAERPALGSGASAFGGVGFRRMTWARIPNMVLDSPWIGVGPGQFASRFPPYRDPREIELSSHARRSETSTEVEHAHDDWLQAFAEFGLLGGVAWLAFGLIASVRALRTLRSAADEDPWRAAIALAALGALASATFNSPFFEGPAFAASAPLLGALLGPARPPRARSPRQLWAPACVALLALGQAPAAWNFVRHGRALARVADEATAVVAGQVVQRFDAKQGALEDALEACPDSTVALVERAHLARVAERGNDEQLVLWTEILAWRPYHFEALLSVANLFARKEHFQAAEAFYARAAAVDAASPILVRNRLLVALRVGHVGRVLELLARASGQGALDRAWLERSAAELLLSGRPHLGLPLLQRADPSLALTSAEEAYALSRTSADALLADAFLAHAHFTWAREHAAAGDAAAAVRSYRQCLAVTDRYPDLAGGARRVRLELAAALALRGSVQEAEVAARSVALSPVDLRELPDWARTELSERGWLDERGE